MADQTTPQNALEKEVADLSQTERKILSSQRKALHAQDITNLLMVAATVLMALATAFCALASWRMARISRDFFQAAERPYFGISSIWLDINNPTEPTSWVQFKNFGSIPADRTVIDVSTSIGGRPVLGGALRAGMGTNHVVMSLGELTPQTTYLFGAMFPPQYAKAVADGSSALVVSVKASYMDAPGRRYCFDMNYIYYWPLKKYDPAGGSNDCDSGSPTYSDATTLSRLMAAPHHR
jgi:hypothetical protein